MEQERPGTHIYEGTASRKVQRIQGSPNVSNEANAYRIDSREEWDEVTSGASESGGVKTAPGWKPPGL